MSFLNKISNALTSNHAVSDIKAVRPYIENNGDSSFDYSSVLIDQNLSVWPWKFGKKDQAQAASPVEKQSQASLDHSRILIDQNQAAWPWKVGY